MANKTFLREQVIFKEGDESDYAYIIKKGKVEITRLVSDTDETMQVATLGEGDVFGEMGIVSEKPRSATVKVLEDVTVSEISYNDFLSLLVDKPEEGIRYLRILFERMRETDSNTNVQRILSDQRRKKNQEENIALSGNVKKRLKMVPLSDRAAEKIGPEGRVLKKFPFRVGRKTRSDGGMGINDIYLLDEKPYTVSRNHFSIERLDGMFIIRDRGSRLGMIINDDIFIGGNSNKNSFLVNSVRTKFAIGNSNSPQAYLFGIIVEKDEA